MALVEAVEPLDGHGAIGLGLVWVLSAWSVAGSADTSEVEVGTSRHKSLRTYRLGPSERTVGFEVKGTVIHPIMPQVRRVPRE